MVTQHLPLVVCAGQTDSQQLINQWRVKNASLSWQQVHILTTDVIVEWWQPGQPSQLTLHIKLVVNIHKETEE